VCCDNPNANELTINILAAVAQQEAKDISARTSAALQALKARGEPWASKKSGKLVTKPSQDHRGGSQGPLEAGGNFAERMLPVIEGLQSRRVTTLPGIAEELTGCSGRRHGVAPIGRRPMCGTYSSEGRNLDARSR
jgi:hypothetical protein